MLQWKRIIWLKAYVNNSFSYLVPTAQWKEIWGTGFSSHLLYWTIFKHQVMHSHPLLLLFLESPFPQKCFQSTKTCYKGALNSMLSLRRLARQKEKPKEIPVQTNHFRNKKASSLKTKTQLAALTQSTRQTFLSLPCQCGEKEMGDRNKTTVGQVLCMRAL